MFANFRHAHLKKTRYPCHRASRHQVPEQSDDVMKAAEPMVDFSFAVLMLLLVLSLSSLSESMKEKKRTHKQKLQLNDIDSTRTLEDKNNVK